MDSAGDNGHREWPMDPDRLHMMPALIGRLSRYSTQLGARLLDCAFHTQLEFDGVAS